MSKKPVEPESGIRPDPTRRHPPIDESVQLPYQVRRAATKADALIPGQPVLAISEPNRTRSAAKIALTDAEIDKALQQLDRGNVKITGPQSATIIELAREGARQMKAHRRGARKKRKSSDTVTRRQETLIQAFRELSPKRQKQPTGRLTVDALRNIVIKKLGLPTGDKSISEDTIVQDVRQLRPIIRLIQRGVIPPPGPRPVKQELSEKTQQEMEAGKRAVAKAATGGKSRKRSL